jgi:hypothetical protein
LSRFDKRSFRWLGHRSRRRPRRTPSQTGRANRGRWRSRGSGALVPEGRLRRWHPRSHQGCHHAIVGRAGSRFRSDTSELTPQAPSQRAAVVHWPLAWMVPRALPVSTHPATLFGTLCGSRTARTPRSLNSAYEWRLWEAQRLVGPQCFVHVDENGPILELRRLRAKRCRRNVGDQDQITAGADELKPTDRTRSGREAGATSRARAVPRCQTFGTMKSSRRASVSPLRETSRPPIAQRARKPQTRRLSIGDASGSMWHAGVLCRPGHPLSTDRAAGASTSPARVAATDRLGCGCRRSAVRFACP